MAEPDRLPAGGGGGGRRGGLDGDRVGARRPVVGQSGGVQAAEPGGQIIAKRSLVAGLAGNAVAAGLDIMEDGRAALLVLGIAKAVQGRVGVALALAAVELHDQGHDSGHARRGAGGAPSQVQSAVDGDHVGDVVERSGRGEGHIGEIPVAA